MDTTDKKFTEAEAHRFFAVQFNGKTWELLDKKERTPDENERMLDYAHASLAHWRIAGTAVHHHRGEWLIHRVHAVLGNGVHALRHAQRAYDIFEANRSEMGDFDAGFAYEALARAHAVLGNTAEAQNFRQLAQEAGEAIKDEEDRKIFFADLNGGDWHGIS